MSMHSSASSAADSAWLVKELTAARIVEPGILASAQDRFRKELGGGDASTLAEFLIRNGVLTSFQAEQSLSGDAHKLAMGPYLLQEPLGIGCMGGVYRAIGRHDHAVYAVKVLPLRSLWNVHLAKKQVQTFAALPPHPVVVPLVAIDSSAGCHYLAWPFVEGEPLERLVKRVGPLNPADAIRIMSDVADGLAVCHSGGIVHGLLKPSNLVLAADRRPRILDLGIGAILSENLTDDETMFDTISTAHTTLGMMDCAAPETLAHPTLRTPLGDAYSFGCVLYFLLTGEYPFPDGNAVDKIIAHQTQEPKPIRERNPQVPEALTELVAWLMQKHAADRPGDLGVVRDLMRKSATNFERPSAASLSAVKPRSASEVDLSHPMDPEPDSVESQDTPAYPIPAPPVLEVPMEVVPPVPKPLPPQPTKESPFKLEHRPTPWKLPKLRGNTGVESGADAVDFDLPDDTDEPPKPVPANPRVSPPTPPHPFEGGSPLAGIRGFRRGLPNPAPAPIRVPEIAPKKASSASAFPANAPQKPVKPKVPRPPVVIPPTPEFRWSKLGWRFLRIVWPGTPSREVVQFSVFGPDRVRAGKDFAVQVFAHPPGELLSVATLARVEHPDAELLATAFPERLVALGAMLRIGIAFPDISFANTESDIAWMGDARKSAYHLTVPDRTPSGQYTGTVSVVVGRAEILSLKFQVGIRQRGM